MTNRIHADDDFIVDEAGMTRGVVSTLWTEEEIAGRYATVNLHNDSPFKLRHFEGERETLAPRDDQLGRMYLARNISSVILGTRPPLTVAVYGRWGEGKTNILSHVEQMLSDQDHGVRTVWFNLWEHQGDVNPVVAMLEAAREAAHSGGWGLDEVARKAIGDSIDDVIRALAWTALDVVMPSVAGAIQTYRDYKKQVMEERKSIQDQQTILRRKFHAALDTLAGETLVSSLKGQKRVVFFIDDLDRCLPKNVVDLLEKIRLFMDHNKCVFVLGADSRAVAQAIKEDKGYDLDEWADHYLEKMVQISFEIPPIDTHHKQRFVLSLLDNVSDNQPGMLDQDRKEQIAKMMRVAFDEQDATVRLIIRTANGFAMDHIIGRGFEPATVADKIRAGLTVAGVAVADNLYKARIERYDPRVMAVLTTIKTCYPDAYEGLRKRHKDRGELLELLFRPPKSPDDAASPVRLQVHGVQVEWGRGSRPEQVAPAKALEESARAEDLLGLFDGKDEFLLYVRGLVSEQLNRELGEQSARTLLSGASLNCYFELGGSSVLGSHAAAKRAAETPPPSSVVAAPVQTVTAVSVESEAEAEPLSVKIDAVSQEDVVEQLEAVRAQIVGTRARKGRAPLTRALAGHQWSLLAQEDGKALLLSEHLLADRAYHNKNMRVTWEVCDLRRYLNGEFFKSLPAEVQEAIVVAETSNPDNPVWATAGGNPTRDRIFLLSLEETMAYLCPDVSTGPAFWENLQSEFFTDPRLIATNAAGRPGWWWLRSPGVVSSFAANAYPDGALSGNGRHGGVSAVGGVRPAFWLSLGHDTS